MQADATGGSGDYVELEGSNRDLPVLAEPLVDVAPDEIFDITIIVRRRAELPDAVSYGQQKVTREAFASRYGANPADVDRVAAFANRNNLQVTETNLASRQIRVEGSAGDFQRAFRVRLHTVQGARSGFVKVLSGSQPISKTSSLACLAWIIGHRRAHMWFSSKT